jgi:tyrosine-protein kinase Etk/Wzc
MSPTQSSHVASEAFPHNQLSEVMPVISMLFRRRWLLAKATTVAALLALGTSLVMKPYYQATTILMPPASTSMGLSAAIGGALAGNAAPLIADGSLGIKNTGESYVSLLSSRTVEDAVIRRFNLMDEFKKKRMSDTRKVLEERITIFYGPRDGLIRMSVEDHDPDRAAELANGYVEEFRKFSATLAVTEASKRRQFYQQELTNTKDKLADAEQQLKISEERTGILNTDAQAKALIESSAALRAQVASKEVQITSLEMYAAENNPTLETAKRELAALQSQLSRLDTSRVGSSEDLILSKGNISEGSIEYIRRLRDVKYYETLFEMLAREFESAQLDEARQGATIQIVDKALPPDKKMPQYRAFIILVAAFIGCLATSGWLIVQRRWRNSLYASLIRELRSETQGERDRR